MNNACQLSPASYAFQLGLEFGELFFSFSRWQLFCVDSYSLKRLTFLSREGYFLSRCLRSVACFGPDLKPLNITVLPASRFSLAPVLVNEFSTPSGLLSAYFPEGFASASAAALALGVSTEEVVGLVRAVPPKIVYRGENLYSTCSLSEVVAGRPRIFSNALQFSLMRRKRVKNYLDKNFFDADTGLVDLGWRGSIQDLIVKADHHRQPLGLYLGLLETDKNSDKKKAFLVNHNESLWRSKLFYSSPLLEFLCSCPGTAPVAEFDDYGNPVFFTKNPSEQVFSINQFVEEFQRGVLGFCSSAAQSGDLDREILVRKKVALSIWKRLIEEAAEPLRVSYMRFAQEEPYLFPLSFVRDTEGVVARKGGLWLRIRGLVFFSKRNPLPKMIFAQQHLKKLEKLFCGLYVWIADAVFVLFFFVRRMVFKIKKIQWQL